MGEILGLEERAGELADYCDRTVRDTDEKAAMVPQDGLVTIYYAEGTDGLMSDPKGTTVSEVFDSIGAVNVADIPYKGGGGLSPVTLEMGPRSNYHLDCKRGKTRFSGGIYQGQ